MKNVFYYIKQYEMAIKFSKPNTGVDINVRKTSGLVHDEVYPTLHHVERIILEELNGSYL